MKPASFEYAAPVSIGEAVALLDELSGKEVKLLAGGQSLVPMMNLRLARPTHLIDLNRVEGLAGIEVGDGEVRVGALTRHREVERSAELRSVLPLLPVTASFIASPAIRARGTIGGSCCHADPVAEWPMVARLLDASFEVTGARGGRSVPAADFFVSVFTPALEPDELLTGIRFPLPGPSGGWGFAEFTRKVGDFAVIAAAARVEVDQGRVVTAGVAIAGAGPTPLRSPAAGTTAAIWFAWRRSGRSGTPSTAAQGRTP